MKTYFEDFQFQPKKKQKNNVRFWLTGDELYTVVKQSEINQILCK